MHKWQATMVIDHLDKVIDDATFEAAGPTPTIAALPASIRNKVERTTEAIHQLRQQGVIISIDYYDGRSSARLDRSVPELQQWDKRRREAQEAAAELRRALVIDIAEGTLSPEAVIDKYEAAANQLGGKR